MRKDTFTTREVAAELGLSTARVRQMVLDGTLPAEKFGHVLLIKAEALESARHRKTKPGPTSKAQAETTAKQEKAATGRANANGGTPTKRAGKKGRKR
jgi:excisionase family DNA binding protein